MSANIFDYKFLPTEFDESQKKAILSKFNISLINAGAGSGKTTTILGRIIYLIAEQKVPPDEILVLVFNNSVASEIRIKLKNISSIISKNQKLLNDFPNLDKKLSQFSEEKINVKKIHTFHSYSYLVINTANKNRFRISNLAHKRPRDINPILKNILLENKLSSLIRSYFVNRIELKNIFKDIETLDDYNEYIRPKKLTLQGEKVKSNEELEIANYLFLKGVQYNYEDPYPDETVEYHPDFHLIKKNKNGEIEYDLYIEHFGLNEQFKAPSYFKDKHKYEEFYYKKRQKMLDDGNDLICTYSYQISDHTIFDTLDKEFETRKIKPTSLDMDEVIKKFNDNHQTSGFIEMLKTALSIYKLNELTIEKLLKANKEICSEIEDNKGNIINILIKSVLSFLKETFFQNKQSLANIAFIEIFSFFYNEYEKLLQESGGSDEKINTTYIDFDDQIVKAKKILRNDKVEIFNHILADEFQDISHQRAEIIQLLQKYSSAKLFFVGDDWQSINGFAGSNPQIMTTQFKKYFGENRIIKLRYTYRFNDKVCKITKKFIEENETQIPKDLISYKGAQIQNAENVKWNKEIPIHFIFNPSKEDLEVGDWLYHDYYGKGLIKIKNENSYIIKFEKHSKSKIIEFYDDKINISRGYEKNVTLDVINNLVKIQNLNKEIIFLTRLNIDTYREGNLRKELIFPIQKKFLLTQSTDKFGNTVLKGKMFKKITFMTVHKSKGLEADFVFLLKAYSSMQGFPFKRKEDLVLLPFRKCGKLSLDLSLEEERRLFYVALTRAKDKTFIYTDKENSFIINIISNNKENEDFTVRNLKIIQRKNSLKRDVSVIKKKNVKKIKIKKYSFHKRMKIIKSNNPNAYSPWTSSEEEKLKKLYNETKNIKQIAVILKRQPGGIRSRLKKMGLT